MDVRRSVNLLEEFPQVGSTPREFILNPKYLHCPRHLRKINDPGVASLGM